MYSQNLFRSVDLDYFPCFLLGIYFSVHFSSRQWPPFLKYFWSWMQSLGWGNDGACILLLRRMIRKDQLICTFILLVHSNGEEESCHDVFTFLPVSKKACWYLLVWGWFEQSLCVKIHFKVCLLLIAHDPYDSAPTLYWFGTLNNLVSDALPNAGESH